MISSMEKIIDKLPDDQNMLGKVGQTRSERNTLEIEDMQEPIELHDREHRVPER